MTEKRLSTDSILAFLLCLVISIPAFLGAADSPKVFFYVLFIGPVLCLILTRKIDLLELYRKAPQVFLLAIPLLYWASSNFWSAQPEYAAPQLRRALTTFVFILGVAHIMLKLGSGLIRYLDMALGLVAAAAVIKLIGIQFTNTDSPIWRLGIESVFNPIHAAQYFGFFAVYGLVRSYQESQPKNAGLFIGAVIPCLLYMLMTFSRGPLISLFLVYLLVSMYWFKINRYLPFVIVPVAAAIFWQWEELLERGTSFRLEIWQGAGELIQNNFWLGIGYGTSLDVPYGSGRTADHAHNIFLDIFVVTGLPGLLLLLAIALFVAQRAYRAVPREMLFVAPLIFFFFGLMTDVQKLVGSPSGVYVIFWLPLTVLLILAFQGRNRSQLPG